MKLRLLIVLLCTVAASAFAQVNVTVDQTARFLAGLPVDGPLAAFTQTPGWQQHAREMDEAWAKKMSQQILPIRAWMWAHADQYYKFGGPMFYMFGGPDVLYANVFYPYASTYILAGLEPVGQVPDLSRMHPDQVAAELATMRGSMSTILRFQYFITKDMRTELGRGNVAGTLPIMYVFLARLGYVINDVTPLTSPARGVKITFTDPARGQSQTVQYFTTDLSGGGQSAFLKWAAARGKGVSLLKAASYLMHTEGFTGVRSFLLNNSRVIIQDDSGIPLRAFPRSWAVNCYGRYVQHGEMFGKYWQPDLAAVYERNPPEMLVFPFGYHWQPDRGVLMLARPDPGGAISAAVAAPAGAQPAQPVMKALPPTNAPAPQPRGGRPAAPTGPPRR